MVVQRRLFCTPRDAAAAIIFSDLTSDSLLSLVIVQGVGAPAQRSPGSPAQQETPKPSGPDVLAPGSGSKQPHRAALSPAPERFESSAQI